MKCSLFRYAPVLAIISATTYALASSAVTIPVGSTPKFVAVNQTTNTLYVSNLTANNVSVIDGASNTVVATVPVGTGPEALDVNATTNTVYVANSISNNISVIDGSTNTVVATIPNMSFPFGVAVNSKTNQVFVSNISANNVAVIDGASNTVLVTVAVGNSPAGICVNLGTNLIYVVNSTSGTISVISGIKDKVTKTFTLPPGAFAGNITIDAKVGDLFITDEPNSAVYVLAASSGSLLNTIVMNGMAFGPEQVAVLQPGSVILISDYTLGTVMIANENGYAITGGLKGGDGPIGIAVNQKTHVAYVAESAAGTVIAYTL